MKRTSYRDPDYGMVKALAPASSDDVVSDAPPYTSPAILTAMEPAESVDSLQPWARTVTSVEPADESMTSNGPLQVASSELKLIQPGKGAAH